jgi:DNA-binding CsgD family transcriptional regulator
MNHTNNRIISSVINKPVIYLLDPEHSPLPLSLRQQECMFLLVRGQTTKQIACILGLKSKTIDGYLETIKHRLNCYSKSQLIEKAIDSGFFYYIPKTLLDLSITF